MPLPNILKTCTREDAGGGNPVAVTGSLLTPVSWDEQTPEVETGRRTPKKTGFRLGMQFRYYQIATFNALNTLQIAGTPVRMVMAFDGASGTYTFDPVRFVVVPVFGELDDKDSIWLADAGEALAPSTGAGSWQELGPVRGGTAPQTEAIFEPDGMGAPFYARVRLSWEFDLFSEMSSTIDAFAGDVMLAVDHGDGTFTKFDTCQISNRPNAEGEFVTTRGVLTGSWRDVTAAGGITIPGTWGTPTGPDFFSAVDFRGVASGATQGDVLTIS